MGQLPNGQCTECTAAMTSVWVCVAGVVLYLLPMGVGQSKGESSHGWGTPLHSFWCCYGSSVESFAKLQDCIYFYRLCLGKLTCLFLVHRSYPVILSFLVYFDRSNPVTLPSCFMFQLPFTVVPCSMPTPICPACFWSLLQPTPLHPGQARA